MKKEYSTLEMIAEWQNSEYRKKFICKNNDIRLPKTAYNNGCGVLFMSYFTITLGDPILESGPLYISDDKLEKYIWVEIEEEYDIHTAMKKSENGACMKSLTSGRKIKEGNVYKEDIMNTCVSLNCPFIYYCNKYNFLVDRGLKCNIQDEIIKASEKCKKENKKKVNS